MAFATVTDFERRLGKKLTEDERQLASVLLEDAGVWLSMEYARVGKDVPDGQIGREALKIVSCKMVRRVMASAQNSDLIGADIESWRTDVGPLSETFQFANADSSTFLYSAERKMLGIEDKSKIGTISYIGDESCLLH